METNLNLEVIIRAETLPEFPEQFDAVHVGGWECLRDGECIIHSFEGD